MAESHPTTAPVFFPNVRKFVRALMPGALTPAQLASLEAGEILPGEDIRVRNLNALADDWAKVREVMARVHSGESDADLDARAWYFVRFHRGLLTEQEQAHLNALRTEAADLAERRA